MPKSCKHHHIHRIDNDAKRNHAWRVQVQSRGRVVIRHFSDGVYGGKQKALKVAWRFRDATLKEAHDDRYWFWRRHRMRRNNTSGVVGVGRYVSRECRHGRLTEQTYWLAYWDDADGWRRSRKFSVSTHGEKRAKQLACQARREAMRKIFRGR
jgi:hypothetical protein